MVHFGPSSHVQGVFLHDWVARQMPRCFCGEKWATWMCRNTELAKIILFRKYLDTSCSSCIGHRSGKVLIWYKRLWSQVVGPCFIWLLLSLFTPCLLPNDPTDVINNDKTQRWEFHLVFFWGGSLPIWKWWPVFLYSRKSQCSQIPCYHEFPGEQWVGAVLSLVMSQKGWILWVSKKILSNQLGMSQIVTSEFITTVDGRNPKQPPGM